MRPRPTRFPDRREAGRRLAEALRPGLAADAVVIGLARGGVAVAAEIARELGLDLDALAVRKIGHPLQPEYAIGAVAADGPMVLRARNGLAEQEVARVAARAEAEARALDASLHGDRERIALRGRPCLLVDDGLATGATMVAAVRWARSAGASRVLVAAPVGATETVAALGLEADDVVCLQTPRPFSAVGAWYHDFRQIDDDEVRELLRTPRAPADPPRSGSSHPPASP